MSLSVFMAGSYFPFEGWEGGGTRRQCVPQTLTRASQRARTYGTSGGVRSPRFERESEERGGAQAPESREVVPGQFLPQEEHGEGHENLLDDLELKSAKARREAQAVRWNRKAILDECQQPRKQNRLPNGPVVTVL